MKRTERVEGKRMNTQLDSSRAGFFVCIFFRCWKGLLSLFLSNFFGVCVFSFLFFFSLSTASVVLLSCNVNREKSNALKYQLGFHPI